MALGVIRDASGLPFVYTLDSDPTAGSGVPVGSPLQPGQLLVRTDVPSLYTWDGPLATSWTQIGTPGSALLATIAPTVIGVNDASAVGVATKAARQDHQHKSPDLWTTGSPGFMGGLVTAPSARALDTVFKPSVTRPVLLLYSIRIQTAGIGGGSVQLRSDAANPPVTVRAQVRNVDTIGDSAVDAMLVYICPPDQFVKLLTVVEAGAPGFVLQFQTEQVL